MNSRRYQCVSSAIQKWVSSCSLSWKLSLQAKRYAKKWDFILCFVCFEVISLWNLKLLRCRLPT